MRVVPLALRWATAVLGVSAAAVVAQSEPPAFPVSSVAVSVYAVVSDDDGRLVPGLTRDAFRLWEDGVPQAIEHFSLGSDMPLSLGLLIDTSPSQTATLGAQRVEAKKFLASVLGRGDRALVMRFDLSIELLQGFSDDVSLLSRAVDLVGISPGASGLLPGRPGRGRSGTRLLDALSFAASELMKGAHGRKVIVLVTDGVDRGSLVKRRAALDACDRAEVIVYGVAVADPAFYWLRDESFDGLEVLGRLTGATGGRAVRTDHGLETATAFADIARELRAHYRLGYSPRPGVRQGLRRIEVRVSPSAYRVRTRRGYYSPG